MCPEDADEFWNLRDELTRQATELLARLDRGREASTDAEYAQKVARLARDEAVKELRRVEHVGSALPESAITMREQICAAVGIEPGDLPYIAELMDLRPEQSRWRVAVEKVLRGVGLRLLVPDQHYAAVLRFVNETNMRGRLQLHHVRPRPAAGRPSRTRWPASCSSSTPITRVPPRRPTWWPRPATTSASTPRTSSPVPARGHRRRPLQGLRPAGHQGRPAGTAPLGVHLPG